uniref:Amine oxidase domain-containing protein n=1 Tax=Cucumis melo TaxID=3656 RepID=A0A9I9EAV3_CUCME
MLGILASLPSKTIKGEHLTPFTILHQFQDTKKEQEPRDILFKSSIGHPIPSLSAFKASNELDSIQGNRHIWFCGSYLGSGSHEDRLKAGTIVAQKLLGKNLSLLSSNPNHMVPSLVETGARYLVTRFFARYITIGSLTIMEEGGRIFTFNGIDHKFLPNVVLKVHNPNFYWKVEVEVGAKASWRATRSDRGEP